MRTASAPSHGPRIPSCPCGPPPKVPQQWRAWSRCTRPGLPLDSPVAEIWPEFAAAGKEHITFAELLSHRAGLCVLDERASMMNYDAVVTALERQTPLWPPGTRQAYHARTFGFLLDEIVRRVTGAASIGEYFREIIGDPLALDFWIGLPQDQWDRVATIYPGKFSISARDQAFLKAFNTPGSVTQRAFASPVGLAAVSDLNKPEAWAAGYASMGGVG